MNSSFIDRLPIYYLQYTTGYYGDNMYKTCLKCNESKSIDEFSIRHGRCKSCRRDLYKESICRYCSIEFRPEKRGRYKFCSIKCRFLDKVKKVENCWQWIGHRNRNGYGTFVWGGKRSGIAHRASYEIFKKEIPSGMVVCHACDNPSCVNPTHLWLGTMKDNMQDMVKKGRSARGENHRDAKVSEKDIIKIRELYKNNGELTRNQKGQFNKANYLTQKNIADMFGLTEKTISSIILKKTWKYV